MLEDIAVGKKQSKFSFEKLVPEGHKTVYEPEVVEVLENFLEPGDFAVDAGASIGFHTCVMAKLVGDDGLVLAFEPEERSFKILQNHVYAINNLTNTGLIRAAAWKENCTGLRLWNTEEMGYSSFHKYLNANTYDEVEGFVLDDIFVKAGHPRLIKIDCEGTEPEVLLGAQEALTKGVDAVILELNYHLLYHTRRSDRVIRDSMTQLGYDMFIPGIKDPEGLPYYVDPMMNIVLKGGHHINVLFSTKEKVRERWTRE